MSDRDQNEFNYKLQRSRTRESSTLTIATVASSASLVLLGLYVQVLTDWNWTEKYEEIRMWVVIMGTLFALIGILYRDVTAFTIHRDDECSLRIKMGCCNKKKASLNEIPDREKSHIIRAGSLHFLLIIPLLAWGVVVLYSFGSITIETIAITIGIIVTSAAYILIISRLEVLDPCLSLRTAFMKVLRCSNDRRHITMSGIVHGVGLQDRDIIQIDATVIAGALILLTVRAFSVNLPEIANQIFSVFYTTILVTIFSISAIITAFGSLFEGERHQRLRRHINQSGIITMIVGFGYLILVMYFMLMLNLR